MEGSGATASGHCPLAMAAALARNNGKVTGVGAHNILRVVIVLFDV